MKRLKLELKSKITLVLTFVLLLNFVCFAETNYYNFTPNIGPIVLKDSSIVVTGDSFAGKFCEYEKDKDLYVMGYARAGHTIDDNKIIMAQALNFNEKNVLISIGVNDQYMQTPPYRFESVLRSLLNISVFNQKTVFFHSYLKYFSDSYGRRRFSAIEYDMIIRELCSEYDNVYYIDVKDLENPKYISEDNIHYNSLFYDELYKRLINNLLILEEQEEKAKEKEKG